MNKVWMSNYTHEYFLFDDPPGSIVPRDGVFRYSLHGKEVLLATRDILLTSVTLP